MIGEVFKRFVITEKKIIYAEMLSEEERAERTDARRKVDAEKQIFENALVSAVFDKLQSVYKFKRAEKGLAGVMLFDMAANISFLIVMEARSLISRC